MISGESQAALTHCYRIGRTTVHNILRETAIAIFETFKGEFIKVSYLNIVAFGPGTNMRKPILLSLLI